MKKVLLVVLIMVFMLVLATVAFAAEKVYVCHVNGTDDVVLIHISDNAWDSHEAHGDAPAVEGPEVGRWSCGVVKF